MFKKPGGGFLNGVEGSVTDYRFDTTEFEGAKGKYHKLSMELAILQDGAEETVKQFLDAGFFYPDSNGISEDGRTLHSLDDEGNLVDLTGFIVGADSEAARFIQSAIDNGVPATDFSPLGDNFEPILNWRVTFGKEIDTARQMAAGRKKLGTKARTASDEEIMKAGRRQDKNDKTRFYNHDFLVVTKVHGKTEAPKPAAKSAKGGAKAATAAKPAAAAKPSAKAKPAPAEAENAIQERAKEVLLAILNDAPKNTILRAQASGKVVVYCNENDIEKAEREEIRKVVIDESFLNTQDGWAYDSEDKKQPISLA